MEKERKRVGMSGSFKQFQRCEPRIAYLINAGVCAPENCHAQPDSYERNLPLTEIGTGDGHCSLDCPGNFHFPEVRVVMEDEGVNQATAVNQNAARVAANQRMSAIYEALVLSTDGTTYDYTAQAITAAGQALAVDPSNGADAVQAQTAADNADMGDLQVIWWNPVTNGMMKENRSDKGVFWERELGFECIAANRAMP